MARLAEITARAQARLDRHTDAQRETLFLPGFDLGTLPNHINRSSLFAPVGRGLRTNLDQATLVSREDCTFRYTGQQLDEADADICMALVHSALKFPLGAAVPMKRGELLKRIGRSTGRSDYEWLHRRMRVLTEATLYVEAKRRDGSFKYRIGFSSSFHILAGFDYDHELGMYWFTLDSRWAKLFGNREYARIDWTKRTQIERGQDMAKALQRLVATSADQPQHYALHMLKQMLVYRGRDRDFVKAVSRSLNELERVEIIASWRIANSTRGNLQATVWTHRTSPSEDQPRLS